MAKINVRSPRFLKVSHASLSYAVLKLYVYTGEFGDSPVLRYTITKKEVSGNNYVVFEVSELIRDFIEHKFVGDYPEDISAVVWAESDIEMFDSSDVSLGSVNTDDTAFDGYGYFEDGINPTLSQEVLQTNTTIYKPDDSPVRIPVDTELTTSVRFFYNNEEIFTRTVVPSLESYEQIEYVTNVSPTTIDGYKDRVLEDGGTYVSGFCIDSFLREFVIFPTDKIIVNGTNGITILTVKDIEECKFEPLKVTFINRFGALQDFWFFKKSVKKMDVKSDTFKRSIFNESTLSFDNSRPVSVFDLTAKDSITLNSGFVNETQSSVIEELLLSEEVWLSIDTTSPIPVNVKTKSAEYKTDLNEKLINHTIDFDYAFDKINDIR
jgi:hypothetical protein